MIALAFVAVLSVAPVQHQDWNLLLRKHVRDGKVSYVGFAEDRHVLRRYLRAIADAAPPQDLAFHLNAYNALVVEAVLASGRPAKVTDVPGFFDRRRYVVAGEGLTLDGLEQRIRARWKDPRVHFALNCAAVSCPPLHGRAFTAKGLDAALDTLTGSFLNGAGVVVTQTGTAAISRLFEWYRDDFEQEGPGVEPYLKKWVTDRARRAALERGIEFQTYHWALNAAEQAGASPTAPAR